MTGFFDFVKEKLTEQRVIQIPIEAIFPNPYQPRTMFVDDDLRALAESIRQNGIIQPLTVRRNEDQYELIAGERRLRAAKLAGYETVPCIIMDISDRNSAILALVENIQREDLNCFEEATALEKLITCYGMTQEDAALQLGRAQSTIANKLRLLRLSEEERDKILKNHLTERHARALLRLGNIESRLAAIDKIIKLGLNVERTELMIDEMIGKSREQDQIKRRAVLFKDVRLFTNTINKAVETMQAAGIQAASQKMQFDDYIEYRIRIPLIKR